MNSASTQHSMLKDEENIVCGCAALSLAEFRRRIAEKPQLAFEDLLTWSGAGTKCTACLLDLEYRFVEAKGGHSSVPLRQPVHAGPVGTKNTLKRRIYDWLDRVSPFAAYELNNSLPVIFGSGIEQWLWITNRSMLFEGKVCAPTIRLDLVIRDAAGRVVKTLSNDVAPETLWRYELSAPLSAAAPPLHNQPGIGSVEIRRRGLHSGIRGTTRPQIEIITPKAACAVHGQGLAGPGQHWFACLYRPQHERMFFSVLNGTDKEAAIDLIYPAGVEGVAPITHQISLPGRGIALHEMVLPSGSEALLDDVVVPVTWRAATSHKLHAICATRSLDRFSIDHL